jgi:diguanylate cyclase (GGDEF)-like protein
MENELFHLLFIDDDQDFLQSMKIAVSTKLLAAGNGFELEPHFLNDPKEGLTFTHELIDEEEKIAVIVSDQQMPELTGIEFFEKATKIAPKAVKILLTGYASLDSAKYAINNQILDQYISKPIEDYNNFACLIKNSIKTYHSVEAKERADLQIKQYVHELERKNERIRRMHLAAEKIAYLAQGFRKLDLEEVFDLIITKLPGIFNAQYSSLFLLNEETNRLEMVRSNHLSQAYTKSLELDERSPMLVALRENKIIVLPEITNAPYDFLNKKNLGSSCIIIPFILGGDQGEPEIPVSREGVKGVLNMACINEMESEDIVNYTAALIKNILGINILNARLHQKTQRLALFDGLTGLYNKHIFMEFLRREYDSSLRDETAFFLAMIDVDDFKVVNDTHGHRIGDEVLSQVGMLFRNASRKSDIISRFGGDEFAWIIRGRDRVRTLAAFERLRGEVLAADFPNNISLSVSIGVAQYDPQVREPVENLIDRADRALYQAKRKGKNRVEVNAVDG